MVTTQKLILKEHSFIDMNADSDVDAAVSKLLVCDGFLLSADNKLSG